jgi:exodeoxyribonuclease-1
MQENLDWLEANPHVLDRIVLHHRHYRYPFIPDLDADAGLYQNGFFTRADEALCREFHAADRAGKIDAIDRFAGAEARRLAVRLLLRNFAAELPDRLRLEAAEFEERIRRGATMLDFAGNPRRTPRAALIEISALRSSPDRDADQLEILSTLESYIRGHFQIDADEEGR